MLRKQLIVLSVMTSLTLSGCSKNESVSDIEKTNNDISVETTEASI